MGLLMFGSDYMEGAHPKILEKLMEIRDCSHAERQMPRTFPTISMAV